jgi:hypothetical protein
MKPILLVVIVVGLGGWVLWAPAIDQGAAPRSVIAHISPEPEEEESEPRFEPRVLLDRPFAAKPSLLTGRLGYVMEIPAGGPDGTRISILVSVDPGAWGSLRLEIVGQDCGELVIPAATPTLEVHASLDCLARESTMWLYPSAETGVATGRLLVIAEVPA